MLDSSPFSIYLNCDDYKASCKKSWLKVFFVLALKKYNVCGSQVYDLSQQCIPVTWFSCYDIHHTQI